MAPLNNNTGDVSSVVTPTLAAAPPCSTPIVSAQCRGPDPHAQLQAVLVRLLAMTSKDDLTPLLPAH